jgi:predicted transcriptional regulator of viral defense system
MNLLSFLHTKLLFSLQDLAQEIGNTRSAQTLLMRYQKLGYVSKVRRGLYCVNNLASRMPEANKYQVASAITPTSYVAYHAAMEYHGLAHQVFYEVAVGGEQAFNAFTFDGNHFAFHLSRTQQIGIDTSIADSHVRITSVERTIIDCIDRIDLCGGWEELTNCLMSVQYLREEMLLTILQTYNKIALYKKVGFLLEQLHLPVSKTFIDTCKQYAKESVTYLTSDGASDAYNASWCLYVPKNLLTINQQNTDELV